MSLSQRLPSQSIVKMIAPKERIRSARRKRRSESPSRDNRDQSSSSQGYSRARLSEHPGDMRTARHTL
ncbi:MAG: hypothetical protein AAF600_02945 [Bacteroidota bacterium]